MTETIIEELQGRILRILETAAEMRLCSPCRTPVYLIGKEPGPKTMFTIEGKVHTCPELRGSK